MTPIKTWRLSIGKRILIGGRSLVFNYGKEKVEGCKTELLQVALNHWQSSLNEGEVLDVTGIPNKKTLTLLETFSASTRFKCGWHLWSEDLVIPVDEPIVWLR